MYRNTPEGVLFARTPLGDFLAGYESRARTFVDNLTDKDVALPDSELLAQVVAAGSVTPVTLNEHNAQWSYEETTLRTTTGNVIPATRVTLTIPFDGNSGLLECVPSTRRSSGPPRGTVDTSGLVRRRNVVISLVFPDTPEPDKAKAAFDDSCEKLRWYVEQINTGVQQFNVMLMTNATTRIAGRRERLAKLRKLRDGLTG